MRLRHAQLWSRSVHAKLFVAIGLFTSGLTLAVAYMIIRNSRNEMLDYTRQLAVETATVVAGEISERDEQFLGKAKLKTFLETFAGTDKSIDQIDVFKSEHYGEHPAESRVSLVASSAPDEEVVWAPDLGRYMNTPELAPTSRPIELLAGSPAGNSGPSLGWEVYVPIPNPSPGDPAIGLVRTYCDLERWEVVWRKNLRSTYRILPFVLAGEFVLLWLILSWLLDRPLKTVTSAMAHLEQGDLSARADVERSDELGHIARRFNDMAARLEQGVREREALIEEIQGLNTGLQERIEAASAELRTKNEELERLLKRLALLREELAQQERLAVAGQLTAAFAHEVGTPLNLVNSHLQLLLAQGDVGVKPRERLETIRTQIARVGDIVRKLLATTRRPERQPEVTRLSELISDLERLWAPTLANRGVTFAAEAPEGCVLFVDRKQMEQLFLNLVNNAVDAMPQGGPIHLRVTPDPRATEARPWWEIALVDTGTGIPEELLSQVFKPLFTTKPEGQGTGLGLAICREIVRAHGGEIRIESEEGRGTTVRFSLPGA